MYGVIDYQSSLTLTDPLFVDVRSEHEFARERIPGAVNLPVLHDAEHEQVGLLYKAKKYDEAKVYGVRCISQHLPHFFEQIQVWSHHHQVILYCKGGGYRSSSVVALCRALGVKVFKLDQGYKGYRKHVLTYLDELPAQLRFVNLCGLTGVGKTEVLTELKARGVQTLDLEGLANHRGSHFGQVGKAGQPSQKDFEAQIYQVLRQYVGGYVFVESESRRIGQLIVPQALYKAYQTSPHQVAITDTLACRVQRIYREYISGASCQLATELQAAIAALAPYISRQRLDTYQQAVRDEAYLWLIQDLIEKYYDPKYAKSHRAFELTYHHQSCETICDHLITYFSEGETLDKMHK